MKKILQLWHDLCHKGVKLPYAHDPVTGKPSITLLFPYLTFVIAVMSVGYLHFKPTAIIATLASLMFWVASVIFYMIRKLHKAEFDLDDNKISLESSKDNDSDEEYEYIYEEEK